MVYIAHTRDGKLTERLIVPILKIGCSKGHGGSNPPLTAWGNLFFKFQLPRIGRLS